MVEMMEAGVGRVRREATREALVRFSSVGLRHQCGRYGRGEGRTESLGTELGSFGLERVGSCAEGEEREGEVVPFLKGRVGRSASRRN